MTAKVMIVDDEDAIIWLLEELLDELGYEPMIAHNGREALDTLTRQAETPALIITDLMMPQLDWNQLVRAIRSDTRLCHIPVIMTSAAGRLTQVTGDLFINKPFDLNSLADTIQFYVDKTTNVRGANARS